MIICDSSLANSQEKKPNFGDYLSGMLAEKEGRIDEAIQHYNLVIQADKGNVELLQKLHILSLRSGQFQRALEYATDIKEYATPNDSLVEITLLVNALSKNQFNDGLRILNSIEDSVFNENARKIMSAWSFAGKKDFDSAMKVLEDIVEKEGKSLTKNLNIALLLDASGDKHAAKIKFDSISLGNLFSAGEALPLRVYEILLGYYSVGHNKQVLEKVFRAMAENHHTVILDSELNFLSFKNLNHESIKPKAAIGEIFFNIAVSYRGNNQNDMFQIFSTYTYQLNAKIPLLLIVMAELFEADGKYDEALNLYNKLSRNQIYHAYAELRLAICLYNLRRTSESIDKLYGLANMQSTRTQAFINLGDIFRLEKQYKESIEAYSKAVDSIVTLEKKHWSLFYHRGIAYERSQQWGRAENDLMRSLELDPNQAEVINYIAYSWVEMGMHLEKALEMLKTATALQPDDGYITDSLGWAHFHLGNLDEAVVQLERAVELAPLDPTINFHLGSVYIQIGRKRDAYFQWLRALRLEPDPKLENEIQSKLQKINL